MMRRVGTYVEETFGIIVPAFQASVLFASRNHALTRVAWSLYISAKSDLGEHAENGEEFSSNCLIGPMDRAFSPQ